jgi:hypothetical protein
MCLESGFFSGQIRAFVINGADVKAENTFHNPDAVGVRETELAAQTQTRFTFAFEPHSVTALIFDL